MCNAQNTRMTCSKLSNKAKGSDEKRINERSKYSLFQFVGIKEQN